jgi:SAM-dependent methyltransferase
MTDPATAVAEYWNGDGGRRWVEAADHFDRALAPMGELVVGAASPQPGERVVEIGCGTGRLAVELATAVAPGGHVVGVDIAGQMLAAARDRAAQAGVENVTFVEGDAAVIDLPDASFDLLVSRFGVMFFSDPAAAFARLARLLRSGGRLAFVCWQEAARSEFFAVPAAVVAHHAPAVMAELASSPLPGPFGLADPGLVRSILTGARLHDIEITAAERGLPVGRTVDEALDAWRRGRPLQAVQQIAPDALPTVEADLRRRLDGLLGPDGVVLSGAAWLVTASRP